MNLSNYFSAWDSFIRAMKWAPETDGFSLLNNECVVCRSKTWGCVVCGIPHTGNITNKWCIAAFLLEALGENPLPCLELLEATSIPWIVVPSSPLASVITPLTTDSDSPPSLQGRLCLCRPTNPNNFPILRSLSQSHWQSLCCHVR